MQRQLYWGPIMTTETSEPWVTLALPLEGTGTTIVGVVYGVVNLKSLWEVTAELQLEPWWPSLCRGPIRSVDRER